MNAIMEGKSADWKTPQKGISSLKKIRKSLKF